MLLTSIFVILSIVALEGLLSVDNSIVISMIANKAPIEDRQKVIKYGVIGALLFRGIALFFVSWLMTNPHIGGLAKLIGGAYLIKMGYEICTPQEDSIEEGEIPNWMTNLFSMLKVSGLLLVILEVEFADFVFSIDNLFAVIAFTENIKGELFGISLSMALAVTGVFLGIVTMRWVTTKVMKLIEKYPSLNTSSGIVILLLGVKLLISSFITLLEVESLVFFKKVVEHLVEIKEVIAPTLESHTSDFVFSCIMMSIFAYPLIKQKFSK